MKKLLTLALFCYVLAATTSCSKSMLNEEKAGASGLEEKSARTLGSMDDATDLLCGQTWVYYEYFYNFNNTTTDLVWKRNRSGNSFNLALNQVQFNPDGSYWEIDENGTYYSGSWTFLNNQTEVQVSNSIGTFTSTIQELTAGRYEWLESNGHYGIMVPNNQVIDTTGGKLQLLTSQPWIYTEYFNNYSASVPSLVWKPNLINSPLNLSQNYVKFNTDGTYWEFDQNGTYYSGNWTFLNNDTQVQVSNSIGTFTSTIQVLGTDRYEWLNTDGITYGEMVHP